MEAAKQQNIYWRNGCAYGRIWVKGKEYRRSLHTRDSKKALTNLEHWQASFDESTPTASFKEAVLAWNDLVMNATERDGLKPKTRERYLSSIRLLSSVFADYALKDITKGAIGLWVRSRKAGLVEHEGRRLAPCTNATIRRELTALSSVFRAAIATGLFDDNPAGGWDRRVIPERRDPFHAPSIKEIELVAGYAAPNFATLIRFAAYTGCRQAEAVGLKWPAVRLDRGEVMFTHTKTKRPRVVALRSHGGDATATLAGTPRHIGVPLVFWHSLGVPYKNAAGSFRELVIKAGKAEAAAGRKFVPFNFHKMRHAFAIRWLEQGGDIYKLSQHLGHTSVKTTEIYLDFIRKGYGGFTETDEAEVAAQTA